MEAIRYVTKKHLLKLREMETDEWKFNQALSDDYISGMGDRRLNVIDSFFHQPDSHLGDIYRVAVVVGVGHATKAVQVGHVDMPYTMLDRLPIFQCDETETAELNEHS